MAIVSVSNLVLSYGDHRILDGVNLTLSQGDHVGLVGRNGCGKSTLMKVIAGLSSLKPDEGQVQIARGSTVGYLMQEPQLNMENTLREEAGTAFAHLHALHAELEELTHGMSYAQGDELDRLLKRYEKIEHEIQAAGGYAIDHRIDAALHGLGIVDEIFDVKVKDLSGGQKARLALAKLLLAEPDLILLDEPTNHLDITGRQWLEEFLAAYRGAVMVVSHDRWLLNRMAEKIYEIEAGQMVEYPGNYEKYRELRAERIIAQHRAYDKQQTKIRREQQFIERYRAGQRASQAQGREKRLDRYIDSEQLDRPTELDTMNLRFAPAQRSGDLVINADHVTKGYEGKPLFSNVCLTLRRGERLGIIGPNGAGKSTLIRCLLGEQDVDSGTVRVGSAVSVGHFHQTHENLDLSQTVVEYLRKAIGGMGIASEQAARDLAGAFLFTGREQDKPLNVLSGGERARVVLAGMVCGGHNLLVLDEPSNHLDIPSAERLEESLRQFTKPLEGWSENQSGGGTLILISHDRMLLQNLVDQLLVLDGHGRLMHFQGTYTEYTQSLRKSAAIAAAPAQETRQSTKPKQNTPPAKSEKSEKSQKSGGSSKPAGKGPLASMNQQTLEQRIMEAEKKLAKFDAELAKPDIYRDGEKVRRVQNQRDEVQRALKPLETEWARRAEA